MSVKGTIRRRSFYRQASDYLRYTFTPMFGIMNSLGSIGGLTTVAIVRDNPTVIIGIFCVYMVIFLGAMVVSFFTWLRYRKFYT